MLMLLSVLEKVALRVSRFVVLIDARALVPLIQADLLLRLAEKGIFRPLWSKEILEEVVYAVETQQWKTTI